MKIHSRGKIIVDRAEKYKIDLERGLFCYLEPRENAENAIAGKLYTITQITVSTWCNSIPSIAKTR